jgi:tight adherence protein B
MMLLSFVVFVVAVGVIMGAYAAATKVPGLLAARRLDRRLRDVSVDTRTADPTPADSTVVKHGTAGPLPALDRLMTRSKAGASLARLIDQSGVRTTPSGLVIMSLAAALIMGVVVSWFVPQRFAAPLAALMAGAAPLAWVMNRRSSRMKRFEEQFPEALDLLARAIRSGQAFQTALGMVADELPDPVGPEFRKTFDQQNYGLPLRDALNEMSVRISILDVRFFVTAVLIQRDTGGNLAEILDNLAHVVRERFKIQRQVRVHTAHGRFTGYVLMALPGALAVALTFINPEHMALLFHEKMGQTMLMGAVVMQMIGYVWIRKVIKIEV